MKPKIMLAAAAILAVPLLGLAAAQIADDPEEPRSFRFPTSIPEVTVRNFPLDESGNLRVTEAIQPPKTRLIDSGPIVIDLADPLVGPYDLDGFDTVSIQAHLIGAPSSLYLQSFWNNTLDMPLATAIDCTSGCEPVAFQYLTPGYSKISQANIRGRYLYLYLGEGTGPGAATVRIVLYLRRNG